MRVLYLCINKANKENIENLTKLPFYHCKHLYCGVAWL